MRGQAAMEFTMTYGWAILVVLVAIGTMGYFGVLSPGKYLPDACIISGFQCEDAELALLARGDANDGKVALHVVLQNAMEENIKINDPTASTVFDDNEPADWCLICVPGTDCLGPNAYTFGTTIFKPGDRFELGCMSENGFAIADQRLNVRVEEFSYTKIGKPFVSTTNLEVKSTLCELTTAAPRC
ncbi:MAG: hypothetical protein OXR66_08235 [Candidatus Woesearchaeota archaeon]|nr:hypothetical protein [Candidatus Woesearchaeota archaeon]